MSRAPQGGSWERFVSTLPYHSKPDSRYCGTNIFFFRLTPSVCCTYPARTYGSRNRIAPRSPRFALRTMPRIRLLRSQDPGSVRRMRQARRSKDAIAIMPKKSTGPFNISTIIVVSFSSQRKTTLLPYSLPYFSFYSREVK